MKINRFYTLFFCLVLSFSQTQAAKYAGDFLSIGYGARAQGMGASFVSIADNGFACYWNPAATSSSGHLLEFTHAENFSHLVVYDAIGYSRPGRGYGLGLVALRLAVKDIPNTSQALLDVNGNGIMDPGERLDYDRITFFNDAETAILLNYSRRLGIGLDGGLNVKIINKSLGQNTAWGAGLDAGLIAFLPHRLKIGLNLQDITTTYLAWDTGTRESIYPTAKLGASYRPGFARSLTLSADADIRFENRGSSANYHLGPLSADLRWGLEYWIRGRLALRLGADQEQLTAGAGLSWGRFRFDYAYLGHSELRGSTRLSASYVFRASSHD